MLQIIAVVFILAGIDIPGSVSGAVDAVILLRADEVCPVVFGDVGPVWKLPGLVLDFCPADYFF